MGNSWAVVRDKAGKLGRCRMKTSPRLRSALGTRMFGREVTSDTGSVVNISM